MTAIIEVNNLSKAFGSLQAVDNISFAVEGGCCFGLLGPNGAGKTTTIEMMEGLVPSDSGSIKFFSQPLSKSVLSQVGIQFQHTALQDYLTVEETLDMFASFYPETEDKKSLMDLCDLHSIAKQDHRKLSGGQKQRLLLALALINKPKIIFLDEPTTGLDPHARRGFWDLINTIKQQGKTVVLTTHYMDEAEYLCDEIVIMDKGKIIAKDSPQGLLSEHFSGAIIRLPLENIGERQPEEFGQVFADKFLDIEAADVEKSIADLIQQGISLSGLQVKSANLDDLFIKLTGHQLSGEEE